MKLLYSKLYKKYYPIKGSATLYEMDEIELNVLIKWIKNIENEISVWNIESEMRAMRRGSGLCRQIKLTYSKPIKSLYSLLKNKQFSMLDEEELTFVNDVLYIHKYNSVISWFTFPTNKRIN